MTPALMQIPVIHSIDDVDGTATSDDARKARQTIAPCRAKGCDETGRFALGGKNFCAHHIRFIMKDFPPEEIRYLKKVGWVSRPATIYQCPPDQCPDIDLHAEGPIYL